MKAETPELTAARSRLKELRDLGEPARIILRAELEVERLETAAGPGPEPIILNIDERTRIDDDTIGDPDTESI